MQALTNSIATPAPSTTRKGQLIEAAKDVAAAAVAPPAIALRDVRKVHGQGDAAVVALDTGSTSTFRAGRSPRSWAVGVGQEHVAEHRGGT